MVPTVLSWLGSRPLPPLADSSLFILLPPGPSSLMVLAVAPRLLSVSILVGVVARRQPLARSAGLLWRPPLSPPPDARDVVGVAVVGVVFGIVGAFVGVVDIVIAQSIVLIT